MRLQDESVLLGLRMKSSTLFSPGDENTECSVTARESLLAMRAQEEAYSCGDYLARRSRRLEPIQSLSSLSPTQCIFPESDETVDVLCREKMCEWSFRVCDHFHTSREIVAFAFSFLDRFTDRFNCDRTGFKLAAMTALYMSTKILNAKQISITSLAELSRGEFDVAHIAEMELILLTSLEWRLNPPTVQSFVSKLMHFLPLDGTMMASAIYQRATFFAELSIYDYYLLPERRLDVAIACILSTMEGLDDSVHSHELQHQFLVDLQKLFSTTIDVEALDEIQSRLWYLYSCSAQLIEDDTSSSTPQTPQRAPGSHQKVQETMTDSPVSVQLQGRYDVE